MNWPWSELGLEGPADLETIKHAYAERLKTTHPEEDPEGFQRLHTAYQQARKLAKAREQGGGWTPPESRNEAYERLFNREERKPEIDFDELLNEEPPPQGKPEPEEEEGDFDYDALIGDAPPRRPGPEKPEEEEDGWDYDALLGDAPPRRPKPEGEDFDFERLFAEGDEERKQAQRRQAEERLRAARERRKAQEKAQRDRALETEEAWQAAFAALHALEVLYNAGASVQDWVQFLHSDVFRNAQHNLDFIFGLEDFLNEHLWLPDEIKRSMFLVYGFYRERPRTEYMGLYNLLLPTYSAAQRTEIRQQQNTRRRGARRRKAWPILMALIAGILTIAIVFSGERREKPLDLLLKYMEEDFGKDFKLYSTLDKEKNRFRLGPAVDGDGYRFVAAYTGERDVENGKLGYTTNYTDIHFFTAMRELGRRWPDFKLQYNEERNLVVPYGEMPLEPPTFFLFEIPLVGAEEFIQDVQDTLEALAEEEWYQTLPPQFILILDHGGMVLASMDQSNWTTMDWDGLREYYGDKYPFEFLQNVVITGGLAKEDFAGETVDLTGAFATGGEGETYFSITCVGIDEAGERKEVSYYLTLEGDVLYCLPDSGMGRVINTDYDKTLRFENENIAVFRAIED